MSWYAPDLRQRLRVLIPGLPLRGQAEDYLVDLWSPIQSIDQRVLDVYDGVTDPGLGAASVLDIRGQLLLIDRGGLNDEEYRRIQLGEAVARDGGVTPGRVWAAFLGLSGSIGDGGMATLGPATGYLWTTAAEGLRDQYVVRAFGVMPRILPAFRSVMAVVRPPQGMLFAEGTNPGLWGPLAWRFA